MPVPGTSITEHFVSHIFGPEEVDGARLVGTEEGLFVYRGGELERVPGGALSQTGYVDEFGPKEIDGGRLVAADRGLFIYRDGELTPVPGGARSQIGYAEEFGPKEIDGGRLVAADRGLFIYRDGELTPAPGASESRTGFVYVLGPKVADGGRLVGTEGGLFVYRGGELEPVPGGSSSQTDFVTEFGPEVADGGRLVGTEGGLFIYRSGELKPVPGRAESQIGAVFEFGPEVTDGGRLVATAEGLFVYRGGRLERVLGSHRAARSFGPELADAGHLVAMAEGLFVYRDGELTRAVRDSQRTNLLSIRAFGPELADGGHLVGTRMGLFVYRGGELQPVPGGSWRDTRAVNSFSSKAEDGQILVDAETGLFLFPGPAAPVHMEASKSTDASSGDSHRFAWLLDHPCDGALNDVALFQIKIGSEVHPAFVIDGALNPPDGFEVWERIPIEADDGVTIEAVLEFRPISNSNDWVELPETTTAVRVGWRLKEHAFHQLKLFGGWTLLAHSLVFFSLVLAARWSGRAWRILGDKVWGRTGAQFWVLLRHVPPVQRWILQRWFVTMRERSSEQDVLPLPLAGPSADEMMSDSLATMLAPGRRLWLQGAAGMGKTLLAEDVAARYFRDEPSLAAAWRRYGYVPIPLSLRSFASVPVPEHAPESWLFDLVARRLEGAGLSLHDQQLLRGILRSGSFVLVLDGANEVDDHGAIALFAARFPTIGLLVTSQADPDREAAGHFEVWRLPPDMGGAVGPLLDLYLGEESGAAALSAIDHSGIRSELRSGYDVRLLADLIQGGLLPDELPDSRLGLYKAMLEAVTARVPDYRVDDLCRAAWRAWCEERRDLKLGDSIEAPLLQPLMDADARIVRALDGTTYAFRHDQMRGYLAAHWAAVFEVSPMKLFEQTDGLWRIARTDQAVMWDFFAELITPATGLTLLRWARLESERTELQVALNRVSERDGWEQMAIAPTLVAGSSLRS